MSNKYYSHANAVSSLPHLPIQNIPCIHLQCQFTSIHSSMFVFNIETDSEVSTMYSLREALVGM